MAERRHVVVKPNPPMCKGVDEYWSAHGWTDHIDGAYLYNNAPEAQARAKLLGPDVEVVPVDYEVKRVITKVL